MPATPFALTRKDFATPDGVVVTDRALVDAITRRTTVDFFEDEWNHRGEHSVEFQVVALRQVLGAHVKQAGSVVEPGRLRFDFSHNKAMSHDEVAQVGRIAKRFHAKLAARQRDRPLIFRQHLTLNRKTPVALRCAPPDQPRPSRFWN